MFSEAFVADALTAKMLIVQELQSAAIRERDIIASPETAEPLYPFFTIQVEGGSGESQFFVINGRELLKMLASGAWAVTTGAFGNQMAATVGLVWALVELEAIRSEAKSISGETAAVLDGVYRLWKRGEQATTSSLAQLLDITPSHVEQECAKLWKLDLLDQHINNVYLPREKWRVRLPWKNDDKERKKEA